MEALVELNHTLKELLRLFGGLGRYLKLWLKHHLVHLGIGVLIVVESLHHLGLLQNLLLKYLLIEIFCLGEKFLRAVEQQQLVSLLHLVLG